MRLQQLAFTFLFCLAGATALAEDKAELSGNPAVLPSGLIMIEGHDVALWGIDPLANDQECWHDNRAWSCGEEALIVLRHYLTGSQARCVLKSNLSNGASSAQCFRIKDGKETDIAGYLVNQGWARDRQVDSGGIYASEQDQARTAHHGIWTSRFQSAEDWKQGIPHYIEYQKNPAKPAVSGSSEENPQ